MIICLKGFFFFIIFCFSTYIFSYAKAYYVSVGRHNQTFTPELLCLDRGYIHLHLFHFSYSEIYMKLLVNISYITPKYAHFCHHTLH